MKVRELEIIQEAIRHARETISLCGSSDGAPVTMDDDVRKMYFELNTMSMILTEKMTELRQMEASRHDNP